MTSRPFLPICIALLLFGQGAISASQASGRDEAAARVRASVDSICARQPLARSVVSILALSPQGDTLACVNPGQKLVPASNMKLLTTGIALLELGADFRFETTLAYSGTVRDGVLHGDLYIVGGADPSLGANIPCAEPLQSLFGRWKQLLLKAGINAIDGYVVADGRYFDDPVPENLGWTYDDLGTYYGVGPTGLSFFENAQNFIVRPAKHQGEAPLIEPKYPLTPWMSYLNTATTSAPKSANTLFCVNTPLAAVAQFGGSFPVDRKSYTLECSNRFGAYTCAYYFCNYLVSNGVKVSKGACDIALPSSCLRPSPASAPSNVRAASQYSLTKIGSTLSAPLVQLVRHTNCESDNFFAETLFKTISRKRCGRTDYAGAIAQMELCLKSLGVNPSGACQIMDGSGLSRKNYVSASFFVDYLSKMLLSERKADFTASLPFPGSKGTLEYKFPQKDASWRSRIRMKSGSMNGVRCYSGYIFPAQDEGEPIVFSILTNNVTAPSWIVNPEIDAIISLLADGLL